MPESGRTTVKWSYEIKRMLGVLLASLPLLALFSIPACAGEITVSAAMSLKDAFTEMEKIFEKNHPGDDVVLNFGPSGVLRRQIEGGAPADVFASASSKEMDVLEAGGMIIGDTRVDFAGNAIVLIGSAGSGLNSFKDLSGDGAKRIVIGNPVTTPFGMYSKEVLEHLGLWDGVSDKLILAEHVRQALDYVARGEVDAGMVYSTDASVRAAELKVISEAPPGSHRRIVYPVAVIKDAKDETLAREFIATVMSDEGRGVLGRYGFKAAPLRAE